MKKKSKEESIEELKIHDKELLEKLSAMVEDDADDLDDEDDKPIEGELVDDEEDEDDEPETPINNNGHKPENNQAVKENLELPPETIDIDLEDRDIPGNKFMFNVPNKHLPEMTRLNDREIAALTLEYTYDQILKGSDDTVFDIYSNRLMKHKIGRNGDGRTEYTTINAAKAAERAESEFSGRGL